ncbi:MAG: hypothetical protein DYG92_00875 [Leptolyngbya sp. PLA1]|nr:hypothetical protein [Leptolyngbya sp. PLA1]
MAPRFLRSRSALMLAAMTLASLPASGQSVRRPDLALREVARFDFEEQETNPGLVPRNWFRDQDDPAGTRRPGFPSWNQATLVYDTGTARQGAGAVSLPTRGGSTALLLGPGVVPVFPGTDYRIRAAVRTKGLAHAAAAVSARFLDAAGRPIAGTQVRSPATRSEREWAELVVDIAGLSEQAAWLQLELLLLQPEQVAGGSGPFHVWQEDHSGLAIFDDVVVTQLPRVELDSPDPVNVFPAQLRPSLRAMVRDLAGESLTLVLTARDIDGRIVDRLEKPDLSGTTSLVWQPALPSLGWYRVDLSILGPSGEVGAAETTMLWLDTAPDAHSESARFGVCLGAEELGLPDRVPAIVGHAGGGGVTLPAWDASLTAAEAPARAKALASLVGELMVGWQDVTVSLPSVPDQLSRDLRIDPSGIWDVLNQTDPSWKAYAEPFFDELGSRVSRWQIGDRDQGRLFWRPALSSEIATIRTVLSAKMPRPAIVIPGAIDADWAATPPGDDPRAVSFALRVRPDVDPEGIRQWASGWAASWRADATPDAALTFELSAESEHPPRQSCAALARRVVSAWAGLGTGPAADRVDLRIHSPWEVTQDARPRIRPRAELGVWRHLVRRLGGRRPIGEFPVAPGVVCYMLAPVGEGDGPGALVLWNEWAPPDRAVLHEFLGDGALEVVDIFGARRPAPTPEGRGRVSLPVTDEPVFIEGVDIELARLLAAVSIDPAFLENNHEDNDRAIVITNPWNVGITGRVTVLEPGGFSGEKRDRSWRVSPRTQTFAAGPLEAVRVPITVGFSLGEEASTKEFILELDVSAGRSYEKVLVRRTVEIGSTTFGLDVGYRVAGDDLLVEARVRNKSATALDLGLTGFAPGQPRAIASVSELPAGRQAVRVFVFPGKAAALRGERLVVRAADRETGVSVSRSIIIR